MPRKTQIILLLLFLPLFLCFSSSEEKTQASALVDFLAKSVNFILLFGGLALVLAKPLRRFLEELVLSIKKTMQETETARREAEKRFAAIKKRLQGLEEEIQTIRKGGEEAGQKEKERILGLARQEADRIKSYAQQEIDMHVQEARRELREYGAELAISLAKAKIEKRLTPELHSRLIDESIKGVGKLYEKSDSG
jgi:F-type H+-transporting ATPase subunit b